jgi:hypothetical protein
MKGYPVSIEILFTPTFSGDYLLALVQSDKRDHMTEILIAIFIGIFHKSSRSFAFSPIVGENL